MIEKEYKTAVEQIQLSDKDKEELLAAVQGQEMIAVKRKKLPFYAGGIVAAAAVMLLVAGTGIMPFSQNSVEKSGVKGEEDSLATESAGMGDYAAKYDDVESDGAGASDSVESSMEESGEHFEMTNDELQSEGGSLQKRNSVFHVVAYADDIVLLENETQDKAYNEEKTDKNSGLKVQETQEISGVVLEYGKSYGAFSKEIPSCTIALIENDDDACDSYHIRTAGSVAKIVTEKGQEEKAVSDLQAESGDKINIRVKEDAAEKGCVWDSQSGAYTGIDGMESDVWKDEEIITVAQIMIEAVKDGEVVDVQKIYIGRKGDWYYGLVW